jgi:NAD kinase/nicotinic acid mononucleotide adenylyltransferase
MPRTAIFTAPFDPPVRHHRAVATQLASHFDRVAIVPTGPRPKRGAMPGSPAVHRATMADLNFRGLDRVTVDLADLEHGRFTPHHELESRCRASGTDVSFVVTGEMIRGGAAGRSFVHREWQCGPELWQRSHFTVIHEIGDEPTPGDVPPHATLLPVTAHLPSESVRLMLRNDEPAGEHLEPCVAAYIARRGLYRDGPPGRPADFRLAGPRLSTFADERNPHARELAASLKAFAADPVECIVTLGGDGTMLRAIRSRWRERVPFFGVNAGGQGFLLNGRSIDEFWRHDLRLYHLPLLNVVTEFRDGRTVESLAFNDAWVERATGQTAWLSVTIDGVLRVPKLVGDGLLVATAAGSSSYARAMGATPVPMNTDVVVLAGSNVYLPAFWKPALLPTDSTIEIETLDADRRPLRAAIDGYEEDGPVRKMTIRVSRTAAAEVAFLADHDPVAKLAFMQFPQA